MIQLLDADGSHDWADFFREAHTLFHAGQHFECGRHILSGIGGMGSLNDLVLGQTTNSRGQFEWKSDYQAMNTKFQALRDRLYGFGHQASRVRPNEKTSQVKQ